MSEIISPGSDLRGACGAVCVHTRRIFDSCQSRDCLEDLLFLPTLAAQELLARAQSVKGGRAELLYTYINVEPVAFNRGYYTVDLRCFYRVTLNVYCTGPRPTEAEGLCCFDKRVILFGSEGTARSFSSRSCSDGPWEQPSQCGKPCAVFEGVDPMVLDARLADSCAVRCVGCELGEVPACVSRCFADTLAAPGQDRRVLVTLGQFSIVRLEREVPLLLPVCDYCMPDKVCSDSGIQPPADPCELFQSIAFPVEDFFPPNVPDSCDCAARGYCAPEEG